MKIYLLLTSILTLLYGCPMAIRENVEEPKEITSQSVAVPGASCMFESELIVEEKIYTKVDQSSTVTCVDGYSGGGEWKCLPNGNYHGVPCSRITCEDSVSHKLGDDDIVILSGESLEITCDEGYGDAGTWSCSLDGELTGKPCRKKCEETIAHLLGKDNFTSYAGDELIEIQCDEGYHSESLYSCLDSGEFSLVPKCLPITCENFAAVANSDVEEELFGIKYGQEISIKCSEGLYGNQTLGCNSDGSWNEVSCQSCEVGFKPSEDQRSCVPILCTETPIANSDQTLPSGNFSDEASVTCDDGFEGGGGYTCTADGWVGTPCSKKSCDDLAVPNSNFSGDGDESVLSGNFQTTQEVVCDEGFTDNGATVTWTCEHDGGGDGGVAWQGPGCERKTCDDLNSVSISNALSFGIISGKKFEDEFTVECNDNMAGGVTTCGADGSWSEVECVPADCSVAVSNLLNGKSRVDAMNGDSISFTCQEGLVPSHKWLSCAEGSFHEVNIACERRDCIEESTNLSSGHTRVVANDGETVSVYCDYGYEPIHGTLTCSSDGSGGYAFDQTPTDGSYCRPVTCGEMAFISNSTTTLAPGVFNETAEVTCSAGFISEASYSQTSTWTCDGDGNWTGEACVSFCEVTVANSIEETYLIPEGDGQQIRCNPGFKGGAYLTCDVAITNETSADPPTCIEYTISTPENPKFNESYSGRLHCDWNDNDLMDEDELIDFPDHSFALEMNSGSNATITLPVEIVEGTDFYVYWDDDKNCSHITSESDVAELAHVYPGIETEVTLRIIGTLKNWGNDSNINYKDRVSRVLNLGAVGWVDLGRSFRDTDINEFNTFHTDTSLVTNMDLMFYNANNLESLDLSRLNTSNVTSMRDMFSNTNNLKSLDLSGFNTGKVTDMSSMFDNASKLTDLDLSSFDTSNVTDMVYMFKSVSSLTNLDLSNFNTSKVTGMWGMFYLAQNLRTLNLANFDTTNVNNMDSMFSNTNNLKSLDLSSFNTSNVTSMINMFYNSQSLRNLDLSSFNTSNVTTMNSMFYRCESLKNLDLNGFKTKKVNNMRFMFYEASSLSNLDLSSFNTSKVTDMKGMFRKTEGLKTLDLSGFNTSKVTNMDEMFAYSNGLESLNISGFDTSSVTTMNSMFRETKSLESLDLSSFDTSKVTDMANMFNHMDTLPTLILPEGFDTSSVTTMNSMFNEAGNLTSLTFPSSFNTSKVTDMSQMFRNTGSLPNLDLSGFDTSNVRTMNKMFYGAGGLTHLDLSGFDTSNVIDMTSMFHNAQGLVSIDLSSFNTGKVTNMWQMFEKTNNLENLNLSSFYTKYTANMYHMFRESSKLKRINFGNWNETASILFDNDRFIGTGDESLVVYCNGSGPSGHPGGASCESPPMIVTFEVTEGDLDVVLGVSGGSINVDWGDGDENSATTHSYDNAGTYEVWIEGANTITTVNNDWSNNLVKVNALGDLSSVTSFSKPFKDKTNLKLFSGFGKLPAGVTNLSSMFEGATSLKHVDFSKIDTSNVSNTSNMFKNATSLTHVNLGDFNHSVGTTTDMFSGTEIVAENTNKFLHCSKEYDESVTDINWNTTIGGVSYKCENNLMPLVFGITSTAGKTLKLAAANSFLVVDWGEGDLTYVHDIEHEYGTSGEKVVKVWGDYLPSYEGFPADMHESIDAIKSIKSFGHRIIRGKSAFQNLVNLTSVEGYGRFGAISIGSMFHGCSGLINDPESVNNYIDFSNFDLSNVTDVSWMFANTSSLKKLDLSSFDTSNVTNMDHMFSFANSLESLNLGLWETDSVPNTISAFFNNAGSPIFSSTGENTNLICENDDDPESAGNELFVTNQMYSCDGVAP